MTDSPDKSRTVLLSGASRGIGLAVCRRLLQAGDTVIGLARDFSKTDIDHPAFHPRTIDLADLDNLPAACQTWLQQFPQIDTLICCAGLGQFGSLEEFSYTQIKRLMDLNFVSAAYLARAVLPTMKQQRRGTVVFIGSEAGLSGGRRGAVYSASKFALRGFAQSLRSECGRRNVRVAIINPGMTDTGFFDHLAFRPGDDDSHFITVDDVADAVLLILDARPGTVYEEINLSPLKHVVRFASDKQQN